MEIVEEETKKNVCEPHEDAYDSANIKIQIYYYFNLAKQQRQSASKKKM